MFTLKYDNKLQETFEKEIDAKLQALTIFKNKTNLPLVEVLDENNQIILTKKRLVEDIENEEEPTQEEIDNGVDSLIRGLLSRVWETIDDYNSAITTINSVDDTNAETVSKLENILDDLSVHVGILQSCLSE